MEEYELRLYFTYDESCIQHSSAKASNHIQVLQLMQVQYCAKVMQTIIDENRDNRELSAIFERYFDCHDISRDISRSYCSNSRDISLSSTRIIVCPERYIVFTQRHIAAASRYIVFAQRDIAAAWRYIVSPNEISLSRSDIAFVLNEISLQLGDISFPFREISLSCSDISLGKYRAVQRTFPKGYYAN